MKTPLLEWTEDHCIGIPVLDFEHRNLFAQINELLEDFESQHEKEKIEACLGEIHARMEAHFALEEKFMKDKKYPHFAEHKKAHDMLLDDLGSVDIHPKNGGWRGISGAGLPLFQPAGAARAGGSHGG